MPSIPQFPSRNPSPDDGTRPPYSSSPELVRGLTALFLAVIALDGTGAVLSVLEGVFFPGLTKALAVENLAQGAFVAVSVVAGVLNLAVHLAVTVCFCVWLYRAGRNAQAFGAQDMDFTPGWAVGWFFVPIAQFFKPFQAVREIYLISDPAAGPADWKSAPVTPLLAWWWGTWILCQVVNRIDFRLALSKDPEVQALTPWISAAASIPNIAAGALALLVVRHIAARQQEKARRMGL